jgi:5'(3')-deoxyribonucleotidase
MRKTYYFDMDGVLANFHKEPFQYKNAISREWIANLEPFMDNIKLVKDLIQQGNEVFILSCCANSENAKLGKIDWLAKYLPEINQENIIILVGGGKKVNHIKTAQGVLIDDDQKNIRPWVKAGFEAIFVEVKGQKIIL